MTDRKFRDKSDLLKLSHFDAKTYEHYALTSLTAYCIYWLQEWGITSTLETLSVASHRMFPIKFAMVGWPQFPDINRTNRSVLQMRPKYRNLATSASDKGVFLNQNGIQEARALIEKLGPPILEGEPQQPINPSVRRERGTGKPSGVHAEDKVEQLRKSYIFDLYLHSRFDEAEAIDLIQLLNVYDHTPSRVKKLKLKEYVDSANELNDKEALDFLSRISERFSKYLNK